MSKLSVEVERIHLPFHWGIASATHRFLRSFVKEPGTLGDRWIAMRAAAGTGTVENQFALKLAKQLDAGLNAHAYIVESAEKRGKIDHLKQNSRYIWVENDLDYPRKYKKDIALARDPQRAVDASERNGLQGIILGLDHTYGYELNPFDDFADHKLRTQLQNSMRSVHLAGSQGNKDESGHGLVDLEDRAFWEFIDYLKGLEFAEPLRFCLDITPYAMRKMTQSQQLDYMKQLVKKLRD